MTRKPDEIKKGLECCARVGYCYQCPYQEECFHPSDDACPMHMDVLAYIKQLEAERDAMKDEIDGDCETCKHSEACQEDGYCMWCENRESNKTLCCNCINGSNWEWRGVQKEG